MHPSSPPVTHCIAKRSTTRVAETGSSRNTNIFNSVAEMRRHSCIPLFKRRLARLSPCGAKKFFQDAPTAVPRARLVLCDDWKSGPSSTNQTRGPCARLNQTSLESFSMQCWSSSNLNGFIKRGCPGKPSGIRSTPYPLEKAKGILRACKASAMGILLSRPNFTSKIAKSNSFPSATKASPEELHGQARLACPLPSFG